MDRHWEVTVRLTSDPGGQRGRGNILPLTFLAVRLSVLHVEEAVAKRLPAGGAHKAGGVPRLAQSVHHFLSHAHHTSHNTQHTQWE